MFVMLLRLVVRVYSWLRVEKKEGERGVMVDVFDSDGE